MPIRERQAWDESIYSRTDWDWYSLYILTGLFVRLLRCRNSYIAHYAPVYNMLLRPDKIIIFSYFG